MALDPSKYVLNNLQAQTSENAEQRIAMLLWGRAGSGKTTLAATAPGIKVWINFDPDGPASVIGNRSDLVVFDFSDRENAFYRRFREEDPLGLERFLTDHPEVETVVVDSITSFGEKALIAGIKDAGGKSTIEEPGWAGYGRKNIWTRMITMNMCRITKKHKRHVVLIGHEDVPLKNEEGIIQSISIMLGSTLSELVPSQLSEVWNITDVENGKHRRIAVRPVRKKGPLKTRMFQTGDAREFDWQFDPDTWSGQGLTNWYQQWKDNGFAKIALPKTVEAPKKGGK